LVPGFLNDPALFLAGDNALVLEVLQYLHNLVGRLAGQLFGIESSILEGEKGPPMEGRIKKGGVNVPLPTLASRRQA
jgi:hypothetical protein